MTAQEQGMIDDLVERVRSTPVADKDVEAERHLQQTLGTVPDALYVLTQTVLVQQYGLTQAKAQIESLQSQVEQMQRQQATVPSSAKGGSFLSRIFGTDEGNSPQIPAGTQGYGSPGQTASTGFGPASNAGYQTVNYAPAPQAGYPPPPAYGGPGYGAPGYGPGPGSPSLFGGGGGGFMRGALQTAAGVAAGEMVFQGMEDLFRGFGGHESRGLAGESVVNNYYGDEANRGDRTETAGRDDSSFYNPEHDASREGGAAETRGFADTDSVGGSDDLGDDSGFSSDDSSGFDNNDDTGSSDSGDDSNY